MIFRLCSICAVYNARQFRCKLSFGFFDEATLVSQLLNHDLFLQLSTSPMDVVSASPQLVSATLSSLFRLKSSFVFATRLLLVSQPRRLHLVYQLPRLRLVLLLLVSAAPRIVS